MKKQIIIITLFILSNAKSYSQNYHALKIGDQVPDIVIGKFFDDDNKRVKISELYKHKLLILDFWGTWCGSCLDEMLTFPQLKAQFGDKLNLVAVGYEKKERIAGLFKRNPVYHSNKWITLYGDSLLTRILFPHHLVPHLAWIDSTGRVIAITDGEDLTAKNINSILNGQVIATKVKTDENTELSIMDAPFHQMDTNFIGRSMLTRKMAGGLSFTSMHPYCDDRLPWFNRTFNGNDILWDLYFYAVFPIDANPVNKTRLIFELNDSLRWTTPKIAPETFKKSKYKSYAEWADSNLYCYDLVLPKKVPVSVIQSYMLADLNHFLNLNGRWEKRERDCYVIVGQHDPVTDLEIESIQNKGIYYNAKISDITLEGLIELLNKLVFSGYIMNESKWPKDKLMRMNTSIKRGIKPSEIAGLLQEFGLRLVQAKRMEPVYIVSEF